MWDLILFVFRKIDHFSAVLRPILVQNNKVYAWLRLADTAAATGSAPAAVGTSEAGGYQSAQTDYGCS